MRLVPVQLATLSVVVAGVGDFVLDAAVADMSYGVVQALGQGAYLPVTVSGTGSLHLSPRPEPKKPHK